MISICAFSVNEAFAEGVELLLKCGVEVSPRGQRTLEVPAPVATTYFNPRRRVLIHPTRDANPFFHFFEALWMLAGRNDVDFVSRIVKRMHTFSDDGLNMQGAYGWRWRKAFGRDQIATLIRHLKKNPDSRRAVLQMWDPNRDLWPEHDVPLMPGEVLVGGIDNSRDVPCNTAVYFKIREGKLNMTVTNRSNDMLWGAYGANVVHMSMLQEYVADKIGVALGDYVQFSDSFHVYLDGPGGEIWARVRNEPVDYRLEYESEPMAAYTDDWDRDLEHFFRAYNLGLKVIPEEFSTPWWKRVAGPMWLAYQSKSLDVAQRIQDEGWRLAAELWIKQHMNKEA